MELSSFLTDVEPEEDWWTGDEIHDLRENEVESDTLRVRRYNWGGKKTDFYYQISIWSSITLSLHNKVEPKERIYSRTNQLTW